MKKRIADKIIENYNLQTQKHILSAKNKILELEECAKLSNCSDLSIFEAQFENILKSESKMPNNFSSFLMPTGMDENTRYQYQLDCLSTSFEACKLFSKVDNWYFEVSKKLNDAVDAEFSLNDSLKELALESSDTIKQEQNKYLKRKNSFHKTGIKLGIPFICLFAICILVIFLCSKAINNGAKVADFDFEFWRIYAIVNLVISIGAIIPAVILFGLSLGKDEVTEEDLGKTFEEIATTSSKNFQEQYEEKFIKTKNDAIATLKEAKEKVEPLYEKIKTFTEEHVFSFINREQLVYEAMPAYEVLKSGEATNYADALSKAKDYKRKEDEFNRIIDIETEKLIIERIKADNQRATNEALVRSARNTELAQEKAANAAAASAATNAERLKVEKALAKDNMKTNKKIRDNL